MESLLRVVAGALLVGLLVVAGCTPRPSAAALQAVPARSAAAATASVSATATDTSTASDSVQASDSDLDGGQIRDRLTRLPKGEAVKLGDPRRAQILDALRPVVERDLKQPVQFEVSTLRLAAEWAAFSGKPVTPGGGRIDYKKTHYASRIRDGVFDEGVLALLQQRNGSWHVVEYDCGSTDYPGDAWLWDHKVPADLFWQPS